MRVAPARSGAVVLPSYPGRDVDFPRAISFLRHLDRELEANWCLLWDRLNAHRAKTTTAWLANALSCVPFFFPSYARELNPVEYLWSWSKMNPLANRAIHEVDQLAELARTPPARCKTTKICCAPSSTTVLSLCA